MKRIIQETEDGSKTIFIEDLNETYHSKHGAVQEAFHVFINNGLKYFESDNDLIRIIEIGLGTGLNAFITLLEAEKLQKPIEYVGIEKYPVLDEEFQLINFFDDVFKFYPEFEDRKKEFIEFYHQLFYSQWSSWKTISPYFKIKKVEEDFFNIQKIGEQNFDLVYFDAFGSRVQPELWEKELLEIVDSVMNEKCIFTTYAAKGSIKRGLKDLSYNVNKFPGPPGKREMMVGFKNIDL
ncbi:tRNA (5-methylaminomethyl-2-thiouridine)(34)-methyltransferase MnmD [Chishuiella sp.]|uniref:tRNA (5-methylaminomethyl-2-thiouridine)(34)-methyltransferase MnmD n=1 Tax=Chishuiella sp. TaxID=1969467 RepID=UPI0028B125CA|nr:tRNA (5-methylaminomethyl-2-thiouridine)(34)-methyltransferase MnmD [Chishuiella sp.]